MLASQPRRELWLFAGCFESDAVHEPLIMSVNLYLVRSGETTFEWQFPERRRWAGLTANRDEQGIVQGRLDEFLNPRGLMQAHIQADKLDKVDFERAWCSSQNRAVQVGCQ